MVPIPHHVVRFYRHQPRRLRLSQELTFIRFWTVGGDTSDPPCTVCSVSGDRRRFPTALTNIPGQRRMQQDSFKLQPQPYRRDQKLDPVMVDAQTWTDPTMRSNWPANVEARQKLDEIDVA